jgi:hypothetical protein
MFSIALAALLASTQTAQWPQTRAERTGYKETSHYADVISYLHDLQKAGAPIDLQYIGTSAEGKAMPFVIASYPPVHSPREARRLGRPIVYVQANIHAGEVEGKEAILAILRRLSQDGPTGLLGKIVLITTPIYNIDGNEKFGPMDVNRPEQNGPEMVGHRENGQGLDLNRDAIKAESPEMRAALSHIYNPWDPDVMMDLHTTDGTRHGYDLTYAPPMNPNTDPGIMHFTRDVMLPSIQRELARNHLATHDYGDVSDRGGKQGFYTYGVEGRYCTHYVGLRGRISVLSEAATYITFQERVDSTNKFVSAVLSYVADHAGQVMKLTRDADARTEAWGLNPATAPALGVRFKMVSRGNEPVSLEDLAPGEEHPFGRPAKLHSVTMPVFVQFATTKTASYPAAYLIPPDATKTVELLVRHGIDVQKIDGFFDGPVSEFSISKLTQAARPFQGHRLITLDGTFSPRPAGVEAGWFVVKMSQPLGVLAFHLLEPESTDGVSAWGFLDGVTEGKPYPILKAMEQVNAPMDRVTLAPDAAVQAVDAHALRSGAAYHGE